jgi:CHAD domain-containing protein
MKANELLTKSLNVRRRKYRQELDRLYAGFSEEAVHDLRVATRRLLALIDLIRTLDRRAPVRVLRRDLKGQLDHLDPLRDAQVMLHEIGGSIAELSAARPFLDSLAARERELLAKARISFGERRFAQIGHLSGCLETLSGYLNGAVSLGDPRSALDKAYARVVKRASAVDPAKPQSFHRLRISVKRFRYGVEIVHPLLAGHSKEDLRALDEFQTALGRIQDAVVLAGAIEVFFAEDEKPEVAAVRLLCAQLQDEAVQAFLLQKDKLDGFWRRSPEEPFPWEQSK